MKRWQLGDLVRLRKRHPCGADRWRIYRDGADIGLRCCGCGRLVLLPQKRFLRRLQEVIPAAPAAEAESDDACAS